MTTVNYILFVILAFLMGYTLCMATEVKKWTDRTRELGTNTLKCIETLEVLIVRLCDEDVTQEEKDKAKRMAVRSQSIRIMMDSMKKV